MVDDDPTLQPNLSDTYSRPVDPDRRRLSPTNTYSYAADLARKTLQAKGTPQQYKATLLKQGVKPDEFKHSNYDAKFADRPLVTKDELAQHFDRSLPRVQETTLNDGKDGEGNTTKFHNYQLPGGTNYRETLLHLPPTKKALPLWRVYRPDGYVDSSWGSEEQAHNHAQRVPNARVESVPNTIEADAGYRSSHWETPNVLAHLRMSDRKGPKGEKILHLEELQSDWAQEGRKKGFKQSNTDADRAEMMQLAELGGTRRTPEQTARYNELRGREYGPLQQDRVPNAPYVDSTQKWLDLGLKRALYEAAKGNYHKLVVTPGEEQAKRYDLSQHIKALSYKPAENHLLVQHKNDEWKHFDRAVKPEELDQAVGKDVAKRLLESPQTSHGRHELSGVDLKVGGEGMQAFYDKMLPQALEKLAKKHDSEAKVHIAGHKARSSEESPDEYGVEQLDDGSGFWRAHEMGGEYVGPHHRSRGAAEQWLKRKIAKGTKDVPLHSLTITPRMRESILKGQSAYATGGFVPTSSAPFPPPDSSVVPQALNIVRTTTQQDPTASHAELGRLLEKTRNTQIGKMVDRYQQPAVGTAVKRLHGDLKGLAQEGEPGRMWYEKSSKRLLNYVGGNKDEAHKLAQLIAIYSPQTSVDVNTANAIKAYNRAKSGQKMWAGDIVDRDKSFDTIKGASDYAKTLGKNITKVPLDDSGKRFLFARHNMGGYENIATADRDLKAHLLMNENIPFEGRKTNNFYRNLMTHIDPKMDQGSTQDLWMARAFGFHDDAISNANKYDFMEKLTHKLGHELGWKPHQVQAAIWTAMKTRQEAVKNDVMKEAVQHGVGKMTDGKFELNGGQEHIYSSLMRKRALEKVLDPEHIKRSSRDFSDFLDQNLANVSWEATPSKQIQHLQGLEQKPPEVKADYHKRISEALQDEQGHDLLAKYLNVLSPGAVEAPGYWQGNVNPASHTQIAATRIKAAGQRPDIDAASKELMNHYADARGLLLKQDAVGYHRPFYNPKVQAANGVEYQFDKDLTGDEIRKLGETMDAHVPDTAVVPSGPRTVRILNFAGMDDHRPYHKTVDEALQKSGINDTLTAHKRLFASDGDLRSNDWKKSPNGEDYRQRLGAAGRSDVLRYISDVLAPKVQAVDEGFAKEHGLPRDKRLEAHLRRPPAEEVGRYADGGKVTPERAAQLQRARDLGFDTDKVWYHSSLGPIDKFDQHGKFMGRSGISGIHLTDSPEAASRYLDRYGDYDYKGKPFQKNIVPVFVKKGRWLRQNDRFKSDLDMGAPVPKNYKNPVAAMGYDGVLRDEAITKKGNVVAHVASDDSKALQHQELILHNPTHVRSTFAQFDPEEVDNTQLSKAAGGSVDHDPSDAQKEAGNYAKERVSFQGLPVSIENKRGSIRSGIDAKGKRWEARLPADYGYVRGTEGADGDHVDCFVGPDHHSPLVVVVDQHDHRSKQFDEHKCLLGYRSERDALHDYASAFSDGHGGARIGHVQSMSVDAFKKWLKHGRTRKSAASQSIVDQALNLARAP